MHVLRSMADGASRKHSIGFNLHDLKNNDIYGVYIFEFKFKLNLFLCKINKFFKYKPLIMAFLGLKFFFVKFHGAFNLFFIKRLISFFYNKLK